MCKILKCSQCVQLLHAIENTNGVFNGPGDFIIADITEKRKSHILDLKHSPQRLEL